MRITPLDIRKQEFRKSMRGLDSDEVYAFLTTVADEYEAVLSDNKRLREHLVELEERLNEFKSMETNLRNTLLTAERVTAEAKENARKEAGLIVREAEVEAERAAESIRMHTQQLRREILELKKQKDNYITRLRTLLDTHQGFIKGFEDDFAEVDREIELIGKKVEEDSKAAVKGTRMTRDRITEEYQSTASDKVTWGDEPKREDIPRPSVPGPGYQAERSPEKKSAPERERNAEDREAGMAAGRADIDAMDRSAGRQQPEEEPVQERIDFGAVSAEHIVDAAHIKVADEDQVTEDNLRPAKIAQSIEDSLYPDVLSSGNGGYQAAGQQPPAGFTPGGSGQMQNRPASTHAGDAGMGKPSPGGSVEMTAQPHDMPSAGTAVETAPGQDAPSALNVPGDSWKDYDVKEPRTDWSSYEIKETVSGGQQAEKAGEPDDGEVEAALSGLEEFGGQSSGRADTDDARVHMDKVEPEVLTHNENRTSPQRQDQLGMNATLAQQASQGRSPQAMDASEDNQSGEDEGGTTWSMEELRKNLSNINKNES